METHRFSHECLGQLAIFRQHKQPVEAHVLRCKAFLNCLNVAKSLCCLRSPKKIIFNTRYWCQFAQIEWLELSVFAAF